MPYFLRGHVDAFDALGGVARVLLYDNLKSAVLERRGDAIRCSIRRSWRSRRTTVLSRAPSPSLVGTRKAASSAPSATSATRSLLRETSSILPTSTGKPTSGQRREQPKGYGSRIAHAPCATRSPTRRTSYCQYRTRPSRRMSASRWRLGKRHMHASISTTTRCRTTERSARSWCSPTSTRFASRMAATSSLCIRARGIAPNKLRMPRTSNA